MRSGQDQVARFVETRVAHVEPLSKRANLGYWEATTTGKADKLAEFAQLQFQIRRIYGEPNDFGCVKVLRKRGIRDPRLARQVDRLYYAYLQNQVEPGRPWENGYVELLNSRMRDELLNGELFLHIDEMKYVVERWRMDYNHCRPHSSLSYVTPAGFAELCREAGCIRPHTPVPDGVQDCGTLS